jgi:hypothetical protein
MCYIYIYICIENYTPTNNGPSFLGRVLGWWATMHYTSILLQQFIHSRNPFSWVHNSLCSGGSNEWYCCCCSKAIVEQFIKKFFVSVFVFQKRPRIKLWGSKFQRFPLEKFYPNPIFVWDLNAWRVYVTTLKGLWYLAINCQLYHYVIILIDIQRLGISMSFSINELGNFSNSFFVLD